MNDRVESFAIFGWIIDHGTLIVWWLDEIYQALMTFKIQALLEMVIFILASDFLYSSISHGLETIDLILLKCNTLESS